MKLFKKSIVCVVIVILVTSAVSIITAGSETPNDAAPPIDPETYLMDSISQSVLWLESNQAEDGTWSSDLGITAMVTWALLNTGLTEDNEMVAKAIEHIQDYVQLDGSISATPTYSTYYTSVCILALSATTNKDYESIVFNAAKFLIESQITASPETDQNWVGGFGYGGGKHSGRPDISNTQFALMALHSSEANYEEVQIPQSVWDNAAGFLTRCQNLVETNPLADNKSCPSYNDGGFIYYPGFSKAGESISYGSSTSAGVWSLYICGVNMDDERIQAGLKWLNCHYTWDLNPNLEAKGLYNYYWGAARVNTLTRKCTIIDGDGVSHNWFEELTWELMDRQTLSGYWVNEDSDWFWENIPELATTYTLLALATQSLSPMCPGSDESGLKVELETGTGDLHVYDNRGGHLGIDYETGTVENSISQGNAKLTTQEGLQKVEVAGVKAGGYYVNVVGTGNGDYNLKICCFNNEKYGSGCSYTGKLSKGANIGTSAIVTSVEKPLTIFTSAPEPVPVIETNTDKINVEPGQTLTYQLQIRETGGTEDIKDIGLSCPSGQNIKVTFNENDFDLDASEEKYVTCTIDIPDKIDTETQDDYILIESSNARPVKVQLEVDETQDESHSLNIYQISFLVGFIAVGLAVLVYVNYRKKLNR